MNSKEEAKEEEVEVSEEAQGEEVLRLFGQLSLQPCIPNHATKVSIYVITW